MEGFNWSEGSKLEIMHKKAWWEAVVIDDEGDRVKLRYVGGSESADEWLEKSSSRLRPQQESVTRKRHAPSKSRGSDEDGEESREAAPERPMRRSRMISDDAKLAQQLQNEELKAASRYRVEKTSAPHKAPEPAPKASASAPKFPASTAKKPDAAPKPAAETSPKKLAPKRGGGSGGMLRAQAAGPSKGAKRKAEEEEEEAAAEVLLAAMSKSTAAATKVAKKPKAASAASPLPKTSKAEKANAKDTSKNALKKLSKIGAIEIKATKAAKEETSKPTGDGKKEAEGTVQFTLAPVDDLPPMSAANSMAKTMDEDTTVMQIKRIVMDHVNKSSSPGVTTLTFRLPGGLQLGNDHSLKYIRRFLWPPTKGKLDIVYSRGQGGGFL